MKIHKETQNLDTMMSKKVPNIHSKEGEETGVNLCLADFKQPMPGCSLVTTPVVVNCVEEFKNMLLPGHLGGSIG